MITAETRIRYDEKNKNMVYEFGIAGHAGSDVKGKDIVCAAVSIIEHMFVNWCLTSPHIRLEENIEVDGAAYVRLRVVNAPEFFEIRRFVETGLLEVAKEYPEYVSFVSMIGK